MSYPNRYVTIDKCSEFYGFTKEAIRQLKKKGQWREKIHWRKAPNGRILIDIKAIDEWIGLKICL